MSRVTASCNGLLNRHAYSNVERKLYSRSHAERASLAGRREAGRRLHAGDQVH